MTASGDDLTVMTSRQAAKRLLAKLDFYMPLCSTSNILVPVSCVASTISLYANILRIHFHDDGAILVRTQWLGAHCKIAFDHLIIRMIKAISVTHGEYCIARMYGRDESIHR